MGLDRCRHCLAVVTPDAKRCPICRGLDPCGRRFALLGSLFLGALAGGVALFVYAGLFLDDWPRWVGTFGDADDPRTTSKAVTVAFVVGSAVFVVSLMAVAATVHSWFRFPHHRDGHAR